MVHPRSGSGNVAANIVAASPSAALKGAIAVVPLPPDSGLIKQAGLVGELVRKVKVVKTGELTKALTLKSINATAGARQAIEAAGGSLA